MVSNKACLKYALLLFTLLTISSCGRGPYFIAHSDINEDGWNSRDTCVFELPVDSDDCYPYTKILTASVRYTDLYKYRNLCIGVQVYDEKKLVRTDTLDFELYKPNGENNGNGANFFESEELFYDVEICSKTPHLIKVYHIMRLDPLVGITNVVVQLDKANKK